jgi:hypothetical protein
MSALIEHYRDLLEDYYEIYSEQLWEQIPEISTTTCMFLAHPHPESLLIPVRCPYDPGHMHTSHNRPHILRIRASKASCRGTQGMSETWLEN